MNWWIERVFFFHANTHLGKLKTVSKIRSFFWSVFFCIRTEYRDLLRKSPYSVRIQENGDQKKLRIWTLFRLCGHCEKCARSFTSWNTKIRCNSIMIWLSELINWMIFVCLLKWCNSFWFFWQSILYLWF